MFESSLEPGETAADDALLRRFVSRREAGAFAELARRHAGLVFGTCLRVTGDRHDAEELTQECFFRLAIRGASVRTSVAGWLHATATRLALNSLRSRGRRRIYEAESARDHATDEADQSTWREIEPMLDEAVDALPDELREAIVLHFLRSLPQSEVAARLGVHQSTVSRRIAEGLRRLNERLTAAGVALSTAPLADLLLAHATPDAVPDASRAMGRVALAGASGGVIGAAGSAWVKIRAALLPAAGLLPAVVVQAIAGILPGIAVMAAYTMYLAWRRPSWMDDLYPSFDGRSIYEHPLYPCRGWTWTELPVGWKGAMFRSFAFATMTAVLAWVQAQISPRLLFPIVGMLVAGSALAFSTFLRLAWKVATLRGRAREPEPAVQSPGPDAAAVTQAVVIALVLLLIAPGASLAMLRFSKRYDVTAVMAIFHTYCATSACVEAALMMRRYRKNPSISFVVESGPPVEPKSRRRLVAILLGYSVMFTISYFKLGFSRWAFARRAVPTWGEFFTDVQGTLGMLAPGALLFLAMSIRPLALARATMRRRTWWFAVALAAVLVVVNTANYVIYLTKNVLVYLVDQG